MGPNRVLHQGKTFWPVRETPYAYSVVRMYTLVYGSCLPFRNTYVFRRKHPNSYVCFGYILAA
jgi:hypothetical protein